MAELDRDKDEAETGANFRFLGSHRLKDLSFPEHIYEVRIAGQRGMARDHLNGVIVIAVALVITGGSLGVLHWVHPEATVAEELWTTTLSGFLATAVRFTMLRHWIFRRARHV